MQADAVLYLYFSPTYQTALLAHLFGVWLVMQQLPLPLSSFRSLALSLSLTRKCTETQLLPQWWMLDINMDRMRRFSKPGFVWSVDVYSCVQSERMNDRCGSLRPRVSGRRILLVSARGNASLIVSAQVSVCLSLPAARQWTISTSTSSSLSPLFSCPRWAKPWLLHLIVFCSQWGVSGETRFKRLTCQNSGSVEGAPGPCWGQQLSGTAAASCSVLGVGMAEWWAHCMLRLMFD